MGISRTHYLDRAPLTFDEDQGTNSMAGTYLRLAANCILIAWRVENHAEIESRLSAYWGKIGLEPTHGTIEQRLQAVSQKYRFGILALGRATEKAGRP